MVSSLERKRGEVADNLFRACVALQPTVRDRQSFLVLIVVYRPFLRGAMILDALKHYSTGSIIDITNLHHRRSPYHLVLPACYLIH